MILDDIVEAKRKRLEESKKKISEDEMRFLGASSNRQCLSFYDALAKPGLSIIGEFKKASPSMGVLPNKIELTDRIDQYNEAVDAISCLTEEDHFNGNIKYLKKIRGMSHLPILRKDFIIDEYQIYEAKIIGADAILLIAAILDQDTMKRFYDLAYRLGMDVLVEVHDEKEMQRALLMQAKIIGVNNRNLKDFSISLETTKRLSDLIHSQVLLISESGVSTEDDIAFLKQCHVDALLIGRAFMESEHPKVLATNWKKLFSK